MSSSFAGTYGWGRSVRIQIGLLCFLAFANLIGCASAVDVPRMRHDEVSVPPQYRAARGCFGCISDHERYIQAFEEGWWTCVQVYFDDIDHVSTIYDKQANGWPSTVFGFEDGFNDAEGQIQANLRRFGKAKAHEALDRIYNQP